MESKNNLVALVDSVNNQFDVNTAINIGIVIFVTFTVFKFITSNHRPHRSDWKTGSLYALISTGLMWFSIAQWGNLASGSNNEEFSIILNVIAWIISGVITSSISWIFLKETGSGRRRVLRRIMVGIMATISFYIAISVFLIGSGSLAVSISLGATSGAFIMMAIITIRGYLQQSKEKPKEEPKEKTKRRVEI